MKHYRNTLSLSLLFYLLLFIFTACHEEDEIVEQEESTVENKYLIEVTGEKLMTKAMIVNLIQAEMPSVNLPKELITSLINDVIWSSVTYRTNGPDGKEMKASGIILYPATTTSLDHFISVQHSTSDMENAPSLMKLCYEGAPALLGHTVVMADYIGYGVSQTADRQHPYLHIGLTGSACVDMIEAAREYFRNKHIDLTDNTVNLMGYSQGGQATLATLLEMERRGQTDEVGKVDAGGTPTDLVNMWQEFMNGTISQYGQSGYIPYVIRGMDYGDRLQLDETRIYAPELIEKGTTKMFSTQPLSQWHRVLGKDIRTILHPDVMSPPDWNGNTEVAKLLESLKKNSLVNYPAPSTPITLYHTPQDESVPYSNVEQLMKQWNNITLVKLSADAHFKGGIEFYLRYLGLWKFFKEEDGEIVPAE